jgi:hypothetical protein
LRGSFPKLPWGEKPSTPRVTLLDELQAAGQGLRVQEPAEGAFKMKMAKELLLTPASSSSKYYGTAIF